MWIDITQVIFYNFIINRDVSKACLLILFFFIAVFFFNMSFTVQMIGSVYQTQQKNGPVGFDLNQSEFTYSSGRNDISQYWYPLNIPTCNVLYLLISLVFSFIPWNFYILILLKKYHANIIIGFFTGYHIIFSEHCWYIGMYWFSYPAILVNPHIWFRSLRSTGNHIICK